MYWLFPRTGRYDPRRKTEWKYTNEYHKKKGTSRGMYSEPPGIAYQRKMKIDMFDPHPWRTWIEHNINEWKWRNR